MSLHTRACLRSACSEQQEFLPDRWLNSSQKDLAWIDVQHVQIFKAYAQK